MTQHRSSESVRAKGIDRRAFLAAGGGALAALAVGRGASGGEPARGLPGGDSGPHRLIPLPYAYDALEPVIDKATLEFHHDKHHAAYVANLNKTVAGTEIAGKPIAELLRNLSAVPEAIRTAVRNQGGGVLNHDLYFAALAPKGGGEPKGDLADAIGKAFGNFTSFRTELIDTTVKVFGSGYGWLVKKGDKVEIMTTPNQDSPLSAGATPLLNIDVWEHAYYLKYQNRRADHVAAIWSIIDWDEVARRFAAK
jgi:Fe-Mn family superoxide dismutase